MFEGESFAFSRRHIGPNETEIKQMLSVLGYSDLDKFIQDVIPSQIKSQKKLNLPKAQTEAEALESLKNIALKNKVFKTYLGLGYYDCITPAVVQRNILENPGWYTQYTPYQAEIAQGRLEALLNFQTMVSDLTALPISNASLLDEATAAAEAMSMAYVIKGDDGKNTFLVSDKIFPQTLAVLQTRSEPMGIKLVVAPIVKWSELVTVEKIFGALVQYPAHDGSVENHEKLAELIHSNEALFVVACDLLALTLLNAPGEFGADIAVGSAQRFGVPLGFGGPHAAFLSCREEFKRQIPGRLVGVSIDAFGKTALRLALQTREQHIRRDKATSNICTAQVLLAVMASMYGVYHGPEGLKNISKKIHSLAASFADGIKKLGYELSATHFFDTVVVKFKSENDLKDVYNSALRKNINLYIFDKTSLSVSFDETKSLKDAQELIEIFDLNKKNIKLTVSDQAIPGEIKRQSSFLTHPVFNSYHSETEMLRYMSRLQAKDLSLTTSMIPLGSCTMKLNATSEMFPVTWTEFSKMHPFSPLEQTQGYLEMAKNLSNWLCEITGFDSVSLQPNAGSQGEYAGLMVIRAYHKASNQGHRDVCLIPTSAHGTNPASAAMANMKIVSVECDQNGNINLEDLKNKAQLHSKNLSALMVTYPSTHGVFEEAIEEICKIIHSHGGQVYMDGANMNAQVGLCKPSEIGADVCHLNLHKTFCIPHGGGGPGMGPIGVKKHLSEFLPGHPLVNVGGGNKAVGAISAAQFGSASILPISYMYIAMMGAEGLEHATKVAILNANYMAKLLEKAYPVVFKGAKNLVAHECIVDLRQFKNTAGVTVADVAKRLMDYGFHAPTVSWPVAGTMMIEPTESESKAELERFCTAMLMIADEINEIATGKYDKEDNVLKKSPFTSLAISSDQWPHKFSRQKAAFAAPWLKNHKFWPSVSRIDDPYGDKNLVCSCPPVTDYKS
ncbi:MAG: aminomethyl-transferring glycine dehydrogenase [Oligoflexia bacterium]|nr:aminomethyl-transferring glycine dehydrogenase [Oligoflexia bacterium]